jgi:hypothetical protein
MAAGCLARLSCGTWKRSCFVFGSSAVTAWTSRMRSTTPQARTRSSIMSSKPCPRIPACCAVDTAIGSWCCTDEVLPLWRSRPAVRSCDVADRWVRTFNAEANVFDAAGACGVGQGTKQSATRALPSMVSGNTDGQFRDVRTNEAVAGGRFGEEPQPCRANSQPPPASPRRSVRRQPQPRGTQPHSWSLDSTGIRWAPQPISCVGRFLPFGRAVGERASHRRVFPGCASNVRECPASQPVRG